MPICSFVIEEPLDINLFTYFDWTNFELIYTNKHQKKPSDIENQTFLQKLNCKFVEYNSEKTFESILNNIQSPYFCFLNKNDFLGRNFSQNVINKLSKRETNKIISGYGYLNNNSKTDLIVNKIKKLSSPNKIYKNFSKPYYYNIGIKYFFETDLVREKGLVYEFSSEEFRLRYCCFVYLYCAEIFKTNGFVEPEYSDFIIDFAVNSLDSLTQQELKEYKNLVFDTKSIFEQYINTKHLYLMKINNFINNIKNNSKT